jgi:hypothetical protein
MIRMILVFMGYMFFEKFKNRAFLSIRKHGVENIWRERDSVFPFQTSKW